MTFYKDVFFMKFDILLPFSLNSVIGIRNYVALFVYIQSGGVGAHKYVTDVISNPIIFHPVKMFIKENETD